MAINFISFPGNKNLNGKTRISFGRSPRSGFSLVELLVVMAIIAVLAVFAMPALNSVRAGAELKTGASGVMDTLMAARQLAMSINQSVEVRIYRQTDGSVQIRLFLEHPDGTQEQVDRVMRLPVSVTLSGQAQWSSLLNTGISDAANDSFGNYHAFRFLPDGGTTLGGTDSPTLTLVYLKDKDAASLPPNFFTLQIDSQTGIVRIYRPS